MNFRSLPRPSSPPDSLGIPRSPFSSFSRELQSLDAVTRHVQRLSSCLVFAYEIAVPNSQLEKNSRIIYKLQTDFLFYLYLLFSLNVVNELGRLNVFLKLFSIVVSQTDCKDTHFFITSKFFPTFFIIFFIKNILYTIFTPKTCRNKWILLKFV